jgi:tRNA 2-thiouridine synthesizing protein A
VIGQPVLLDGGDRSCVALLIELRALVGDCPPGTIIHIAATDPAAPLDLSAWCHLTGHTYLGAVGSAPRPTYAVQVTVNPRATRPDAPWHPTSQTD